MINKAKNLNIAIWLTKWQQLAFWIFVIGSYLLFHALYYRLVVNRVFSANAVVLYGFIFVFCAWLLYHKILPAVSGLLLNKKTDIHKNKPLKIISVSLICGFLTILWFLLYTRIFYPDMQNVLFPKQTNAPLDIIKMFQLTTMVLAIPVFEEYYYRSCLQSWIQQIESSNFLGLIISTIFFLLPHPAMAWPVMAGLSFLAGYCYFKYGLLSAIIVHAIYNSFIVFHYLIL